jgi:hypothetical protein
LFSSAAFSFFRKNFQQDAPRLKTGLQLSVNLLVLT